MERATKFVNPVEGAYLRRKPQKGETRVMKALTNPSNGLVDKDVLVQWTGNTWERVVIDEKAKK